MSLDPHMAALAARTASAWRSEQDQIPDAVALMHLAAHADRLAHTQLYAITGPGVGGYRRFDREDEARTIANRLNIEHGTGTHVVSGPGIADGGGR